MVEVHELVKYFMMIAIERMRMMGDEGVSGRIASLRAYEVEFFNRFREWPYRFELFTEEVISETDAVRDPLRQRVLQGLLGLRPCA